MKVSTYLTIGGAVVIGILGGISGAAIFQQSQPQQVVYENHTLPASQLTSNIRPGIVSSTDFSSAAEQAVHAVVNVKTTVEKGYYFNPFKDFFFGSEEGSQIQPRMVQGSGSGVIIASDGYIVTNNHVVKDAVSLTVTLNNNREYVAKVVGIDATTDLAVLKISSDKTLPFMTFANSDNLRLGEWVLAVGNPFNLTSTVTAGIVSAKGRNINIIDNQSAIEAFIQTDAAVNPGNSGGALINTSGELIGINTAISTHTGSYEGYSFAIPANIVSKVVNDIMTYGVVQRAYLGVNITNINQALKEQEDID
ncbi:MAG: trypsin-like peptidase domain-containing protein, partial [Schleiferiaceae bacterium]|nr:trypsin-like peptidase domain-containing protein [Schleiferiaceae bacterium]